jgi:hypothetical protein
MWKKSPEPKIGKDSLRAGHIQSAAGKEKVELGIDIPEDHVFVSGDHRKSCDASR